MSDEEHEGQEGTRFFTVDEANAQLPTVAPLLHALKEAQARMEERHDEVMSSIPTNGGGEIHREFLEASSDATRALEALQEIGVIVRDPASGLVDFPAVRDEQTVYLCWRLGEDKIEWWHPTDTGFAGRQPL